MKDYTRILTKIRETPWLITQEGLDTILGIVDRHLYMSDDEIKINYRSEADDNRRHLNTVSGVGVLPIHGPIFGKANMMTEFSGATSLEMFSKDLSAMLNDDQVQSIVLNIDSPGGTSDLVQEVGDQIFEGRDIKPIYAIADTTTGSAALWLGSQATALYGTPSSMIGSIGAYTVHEDRSVADAQSGHKFTYIFAGPHKTEGNSHQPLSQEAIDYKQGVINELYLDFKGAVARGKGTTVDKVESDFGGGRMLTAKKALEVGLIDAIMPYDSLIHQLTVNTPRKVQVAMPGGKTVSAILTGNNLMLDIGGTGMPQLESVPEEHADPGQTQDPPLDGANTDNGADRGDRVDSPPPATQQNLDARLREVLNLNADDDVVKATSDLMAEVLPLREAAQAHAQDKSFAEMYPEQAAKLARLEAKDKKAAAEAFADRYTNIVGRDGKFLNKGFPSVVTTKLSELHGKFSDRSATIVDVTEILDLVAQNGLVEYSEIGSSKVINLESVDAVKEFANKVEEIKEEDKVDHRAAISLAAQRHPELFEEYQKSIPGRR